MGTEGKQVRAGAPARVAWTEARAVALAPGTLALAGIVLVGLVLRGLPFLGTTWPLADGGLFYQMVGELRANAFAIPSFTGYNAEGLPFAYPPLALELAAVVEATTGLARADVFRFLPLAFATACIPAAYLVVREILPDLRHALVATLVYATVPYAWSWLTPGSGVTRAVGFLFALLATAAGLRLIAAPTPRRIAATGILTGLGALSHPEAPVFVGIALGVAWLSSPGRGRALVGLLGAALVSVAVALPWLAIVVSRHGLGPFLAASQVHRDPLASVVAYAFAFLLASPLPLAALLDVAGQVRDLVGRHPRLVVWRAAVFLLDIRYAFVAAVVPVACLAAEGLLDVLAPAVAAAAGRIRARGDRAARIGEAGDVPGVAAGFAGGSRTATAPAVVGWGLFVVASVVSALLAPPAVSAPSVALGSADRTALAWVRDHAPAGQAFLVIATDRWGSDPLSEWFPALTGRRSVATSQGLEWVDPAVRAAEAAAEDRLRACETPVPDAGCVAAWLHGEAPKGTAVYIAGPESMFADPRSAPATFARAVALATGDRVGYASRGATVLEP